MPKAKNRIRFYLNRIRFYLNSNLSNKIYQLSKQTKKSYSDITRKALEQYIKNVEKQNLEKELEEGYKANYDYYLKQQKEWKYTDIKM